MAFEFEKGEVLLIDKPLEWTSFDVVRKLKFAIRKKKLKIGHAGTLDPLATGLLIVCTGKCTKQIEQIQAQQKEYIGTFTIGKTTPSFDLETDFDSESPYNHLSNDEIKEARLSLTGEISQTPPVFSAVKVNGKRAYESARKGESVKLKPRTVTVHTFEITSIDLPIVSFKITCSKGTYIRSIAHDFGKNLGCGAHLSSLRRTKIGEFDVDNAYQLDNLVSKLKELSDFENHS